MQGGRHRVLLLLNDAPPSSPPQPGSWRGLVVVSDVLADADTESFAGCRNASAGT